MILSLALLSLQIAMFAISTPTTPTSIQYGLWVAIVLSFLNLLALHLESARTVERLRRVLSDLKSVGRMVMQASLAVSDLSEKALSEGTETVDSIRGTSQAVTEISKLMTANSQKSKTAFELTDHCNQISSQISESLRRLGEVMASLSKRSLEIKNITSVIDDIAFQTNILALNASVEAARAGANGRGFSVVADAVRNLAQKSSESARNISGLIEVSTSEIQNVSRISTASAETFKELAAGINSAMSINQDIAASSAMQLASIENVNKTIRSFNTESISDVSKCAALFSKETDRLEDVLFDLTILANGNVSEDLNQDMEALKKTLSERGPITVRGTANIIGKPVPNLIFGSTSIVGQYKLLDEVKCNLGGTATLFVLAGADFIRVSTNVLKADGGRAVGTALARGPAHDALIQGRSYRGDIEILGGVYQALYEPMLQNGRVVGASYFGYKKRSAQSH